jgi:hypothetical protein
MDSVLLVHRRREGLCPRAEGIDLTLTRETSAGPISATGSRVGHFDVAHMLAPMPIAASLGLTPLATPMIAPYGAGARRQRRHRLAELWRQTRVAAGAPDDA